MTIDLLSAPAQTVAVTRGAQRLLFDMGYDCLGEFTFRSGRRADLIGIDRAGRIAIVEVKVSVPDFRGDTKWHDYLEWCDAFYFAVPGEFPRDLLPDGHGLIVADAWGGEVLRPPFAGLMHPSRRKALTLQFGRVAARRLAGLGDQSNRMDW
jgi:hypothetical protein